jgi:hypothetical protein
VVFQWVASAVNFTSWGACAAIGREFSYELAVSVGELAQERFHDALQRLVDAGLVFQNFALRPGKRSRVPLMRLALLLVATLVAAMPALASVHSPYP